MILTPLVYLGWRNYSRNLPRYRVLLLALSLDVALFTFVLGLVGGITATIQEKAARYFAGDVAVQQFGPWQETQIQDPLAVEEALSSLDVPVLATSRRSVYYQVNTARLFFAGDSVAQRRLTGVEWELEQAILSRMTLTEGLVPDGQDPLAILVSTAIARELGLRAGDEVLLSLVTQSGQSNTVFLIVRGIFAESSFFGYTSYLDRKVLNGLMGVAEDSVNEMGIYLRNRSDQRIAAEQVWSSLASLGERFPVLYNREQRDAERAATNDVPRFAVLALDAQLAEIKDLLDALTLLSAGIITLFALLVMIGVSNTYSILVYERTKEIGTLRALGLTKPRVTGLFLAESLCLGLSGAAIGLVGGVGLLSLVRYLTDFSQQSWADLFLVQGRLDWKLSLANVVLLLILALGSSVLGSLRSALRAADLAPVDALRQE